MGKYLNYFFVILLLISYLAPYVSPVNAWPVAFVSIFYPWFLGINLLFVLYWTFKKRQLALLSLFVILLGYNHLTGFVHFSKTPEATPKALKIMTYNLAGLSALSTEKRAAQISALGDFIKLKNCSVLCFQEFIVGETAVKQLSSKLNLDNYPYRHFLKEKAVIILSKLPLSNNNQLFFDPVGNGFIYSDISYLNTKIRLFCGHLHSSSVSTNANRIANNVEEGSLDKNQAVLELRGMLGKFRKTSKLRAAEAENLAFELSRSPYPNIVCCDMNETPQSYAYHTITKTLRDGFKVVGNGVATTYNGVIPALRIDYILASPSLKFVEYRKEKIKFSDHYPVIATITVP